MTIISIRRFVARPLRRVAVTRRPAPPRRRAYPDPFFADPAAVEDDRLRMRRRTRV
jgi:hypothetical protein